MIVRHFPKVSLRDTYFEHVTDRRQRTRHIPIFGARLPVVMRMVLKKFALATTLGVSPLSHHSYFLSFLSITSRLQEIAAETLGNPRIEIRSIRV